MKLREHALTPRRLLQKAGIDARMGVQVAVVDDVERRITQIDRAIEKATAKSRTASAMALADQQRKTCAEQRGARPRPGRAQSRMGGPRCRGPEG